MLKEREAAGHCGDQHRSKIQPRGEENRYGKNIQINNDDNSDDELEGAVCGVDLHNYVENKNVYNGKIDIDDDDETDQSCIPSLFYSGYRNQLI